MPENHRAYAEWSPRRFQSFCLFPSVKTCSINAPQCVFLGQVVSGYPAQIRGIGRDPDDSQNDSLPRRRPQRHRCRPRKYCSRTTSSYGEAGWPQPRDYDLLLESRGLLQGLPAMAQRSPQALTPVPRYQVGPVVRILVPEDEWNITLVSAQRQGSCEGKNTTALGCDPNASTASPTRLIHQDVSGVGEYMLCGNDGIDALGKPCSVYVNSNRPNRAVGKLKLPFYHDGFPTLPQSLLLLSFLILRKRRRMFMRKIADRVNIITPVIVMDRQLTIDSKLPL